jgi:hypothetical protein
MGHRRGLGVLHPEMEYRGKQYIVVHGTWKWSVVLDGLMKSGKAATREAAVKMAELEIDRVRRRGGWCRPVADLDLPWVHGNGTRPKKLLSPLKLFFDFLIFSASSDDDPGASRGPGK